MNGPQLQSRSAADWGLFALLTLFWAGAYALTRVAVDKGNPDMGLPVAWVLPGRLTIGAAVLWVLMLARGQKLPPLRDRKRWVAIIGMGLAGSVFPFFLITTAQETVNSSLAALYTAAVPIFVVSGATFLFADERMNRGTAIGVLTGFAGVAVLFGPDAMKGLGDASVVAQLLLILATMNYALASLMARGAPRIEAIPFATGFVTLAAVVSWPLAFTVHHWVALYLQSGWLLATVAAAGTFVGGAIWSWLYSRTRSIWPGYLSHALADVGVFVAGWLIIFG